MLEVQSPLPMREGESVALGFSTKHLLHFVIGVACSAPFAIPGYFLFPLLGMSKLASLFVAVGVGALFALVPAGQRPVAEWLWLSVRLTLRPKLIVYDRAFRIRVHRRGEGGA